MNQNSPLIFHLSTNDFSEMIELYPLEDFIKDIDPTDYNQNREKLSRK